MNINKMKKSNKDIVTESTPLMPRDSAKLISRLAKDVFIEEEGVKNISCEILEGLKNRKISIENFFNHELLPKEDDPRALDWIFILDVLNFCFWNKKDDTRWKVNGESGYFALCAAIKRSLEEGIPILDASFCSKITKSELENILRGDSGSTAVPLLDERVQNLQEVGRVLLEKYNGTFQECVKRCNGSAEKLLKLIVQDFECFRDEAVFKGHKVSFYKRAQILVADVWACFKGKGFGKFHDIDSLTMFADYRVPQVLVHFGAMRYSNSLLSKLQSESELKPGCDEEIEIRGCSIETVERVVKEVRSLIVQYPLLELKESDCGAAQIDFFLWYYRRQHREELDKVPYHKVRTIYY